MVFGRNLRLTRIGQNLSIYDVAAKAEVDWSYLAQIERGERSVGIDVMAALAEAVDTPLFQLLNPALLPINETGAMDCTIQK
ncbi:helix-turn-helix domain-containing protein (plasmid) [Deinococcus sp. PESE-38]